ncbi:unnamed protein product, partial [Protopolystoma xenopodis]
TERPSTPSGILKRCQSASSRTTSPRASPCSACGSGRASSRDSSSSSIVHFEMASGKNASKLQLHDNDEEPGRTVYRAGIAAALHLLSEKEMNTDFHASGDLGAESARFQQLHSRLIKQIIRSGNRRYLDEWCFERHLDELELLKASKNYPPS